MDLEPRVRAVMEELRDIEQELQAPGADALLSPEPLRDDLAREFKAAVDHLRMSLWAYMELRSGTSNLDREARIQAFRVERAAEMLVALRTQMSKAGFGDEAHARTLLTEVHALAELTPEYGRKRSR